ncbi:MAG: hypothetical protein RL032_1360 [Pseudomonadota bacterium]
MPPSSSIHPPAAHAAPLRWDVFCQVIDNFGDIGVCWRLCADLAARGHAVRLWVDDASALQWMAPGALEGRIAGIEVCAWADSMQPQKLSSLPAADVWIEGFGCEIAPEFIAAYAKWTGAKGLNDSKSPVWVNLEYLSAERYVERAHGLPSPVMSGPAKGATKHFFYPGFTERTGGLLREPDLAARQAEFDRDAWLQSHQIAPQLGARLVSLFCYESPALPQLLVELAQQPQPTHLLVTPGRATAAVQAAVLSQNTLQPSWNMRNALSISYLPALTQHDFDHLLWACDLNFVRGEDSLVRALWAGKPLVWHIYPQSDAAHHHKLDAFLDMLGTDAALRQTHLRWNGVAAAGDAHANPVLPWDSLLAWNAIATRTRARMLQMDDLTTQLVNFVLKKR